MIGVGVGAGVGAARPGAISDVFKDGGGEAPLSGGRLGAGVRPGSRPRWGARFYFFLLLLLGLADGGDALFELAIVTVCGDGDGTVD